MTVFNICHCGHRVDIALQRQFAICFASLNLKYEMLKDLQLFHHSSYLEAIEVSVKRVSTLNIRDNAHNKLFVGFSCDVNNVGYFQA
jgi:hypothetical protein